MFITFRATQHLPVFYRTRRADWGAHRSAVFGNQRRRSSYIPLAERRDAGERTSSVIGDSDVGRGVQQHSAHRRHIRTARGQLYLWSTESSCDCYLHCTACRQWYYTAQHHTVPTLETLCLFQLNQYFVVIQYWYVYKRYLVCSYS